MKKILCLIAIVIFLVGCGSQEGPKLEEKKDAVWSVIESPHTGRCYEVLIYKEFSGYKGYGFMGMSEIPCEEMRK